MRYPASEKLEIIRQVEQSHLPAKRTLDMLGIPRTTFYRWYDRYLSLGAAGLEDRPSRPARVWNRIPDKVRKQVVDLALEQPELSPRELAARFTDSRRYFVSEASVYRVLKAHDLVTSPAFVVIKAAEEFHEKTTRPNQLWQTDFTYLKVIGWGWFYLSTILDDYSRYVIAWRLCTTMKASDVTATLEDALVASGCARATVAHRPRLLSELPMDAPLVQAPLATAAVTSPGNWPTGLLTRAWITSGALPATLRHRARSSAGTRPSRTASCSRTTTCPALWNRRSATSSTTTTITATTRAWATSRPPTSISAGPKPS